tara:strand:- start:11088 stop:11960 length:873 start_codon:yes stop_codon:yes gene_type:complete
MSEETTNSGNVESTETTTQPETTEQVEQPSSGAPFPQDDYDQRVEQLLQQHEKKQSLQEQQQQQDQQQQDIDYASMKLEEGESWDKIFQSMPENVQRAMGSLRGDYTRKMQELAKQRRELKELQSNLTTSEAYQSLQATAQAAREAGEDFDPFDNQSMSNYINGLVAQRVQEIMQPLAIEQQKNANMRRLNDFMDEHPELRTDEQLRQEVASLLQKNESMTLQQGYWIVKGQRSEKQNALLAQKEQQKKQINKQVADRIGSGRKSGMTAPPNAEKMSGADIYNYLLAQKK